MRSIDFVWLYFCLFPLNWSFTEFHISFDSKALAVLIMNFSIDVSSGLLLGSAFNIEIKTF